MSLPPRLLLIDDDVDLCDLVGELLRAEGFDVTAVQEPERGVDEALTGKFAMVLLDVMLPRMNGFDVLRRIRARSAVPVIMLTARGEDVDRIVGLELGADDYLPKPFHTRELIARIHAVRRRSEREGQSAADPETLVIDDVELDLAGRTVRRGGELVELTGVEFTLLEVLLRSAGRVVEREELFRAGLGRRPHPDDRAVDMHVSNLRRKLGPAPGAGPRIRAVRGVGYVYPRHAGGDAAPD